MTIDIVYAQEDFPEKWAKSIFLAGPSPRANLGYTKDTEWRSQAIKLLEQHGFDGVVFNPEKNNWNNSLESQVNWETTALNMADVILFWIPRDLKTLPGLTTNIEFGRWVDSRKIVVGYSGEERYINKIQSDINPESPPKRTLDETVLQALDRLNNPVMREGGERYVPLHIWNSPQFQSWYSTLKANGNRLDEARVLWTFFMPKKQILFSFVLWVKVWIEAEKRHKKNEWVFSRTDISAAVLYTPSDTILDSEIVLIREFRSPARTNDGFIHELPSGSSYASNEPAVTVVAHEVEEETSVKLAPERYHLWGSRQVAGTLSSHCATVFSVQLSNQEMEDIKAKKGQSFGLASDSERTYIETGTFREILSNGNTDWATIGMISQVLNKMLISGTVVEEV